MNDPRRYIASVPPAHEPGRNNELNGLAYRVLERFGDLGESDFFSILHEWAGHCSPPMAREEAEKTIRSAWNGARAKGSVGTKAKAPSYKCGGSETTKPTTAPRPQAVSVAPTPKPSVYDLTDQAELPAPIPDATRQLIRTLYHAGEGIRICAARLDSEGHEVPIDRGVTLSREEWLRKFDAANGDPNKIWSSPERTGIYMSPNPMKIGGAFDADVTAFRFCLVEFDDISIDEQWTLYTKSRIPCAAVISSGGKSLHAWVKVEAATRAEYDQRVATLYQHFERAGYKPDAKNKNPSRLSRLPGCVRKDRRQELHAVSIGSESFTEWLSEIQAEGCGTTYTLDDILGDFDPTKDPNEILGQRWLCRGGSCLVIGPSGVGKSSLTAQFAITWALGLPAWDITPGRPLKSLIVQAENDRGDMHEMISGVLKSLGDPQWGANGDRLRSNIVVVTNTRDTAQRFTEVLHRLIDLHKPDLVWLDPILSFIGADVSRQEVCSQFFRNWLNPISDATGVVWMCVHHTGKPPSDAKAKAGWTHSDQSYSGIGSSEMVNWARATMILRAVDDHGNFELKLSKRGKRAGATHPNGEPTSTLWLRHAKDSICWEQVEPPSEPEPKPKKEKAGRSPIEIVSLNMHTFLSACPEGGEGLNQIAQRLEQWLADSHKIDLTFSTIKKNKIPELVACGKLAKSGKFYIPGPNK